nr:aaa-atpase [Quercus suber]
MNIKDQQGNRRWRSIPFMHPSTFETISMEEDLKNKVKSDLESFLKGKQYYHRLGRVWRCSFLLYGFSGTGKSSFVAAIANFLSYDVYDIDVSKVSKDLDQVWNRVGPAATVANIAILHLLNLLDQLRVAPF